MRITELTELHKDSQFILEQLSKDCQPFLKRIGNKITEYPVYRGMPFMKKADSITRKQVRLDARRPMSSAQIKHDRYNNYFEEMFGEPFRNSLFVSGSREMALYYGFPFMIFPIGEFDWVWSTDVRDLALDIRWPPVAGHINVPPSQDTVDQILGDANYTINSNFLGAIQSGNEIMIRCKEYYAVRPAVLKGVSFQ